MAEGGLEAATISAIADVAHVAVGSIYSHFPGKEALLLELFLDRAEPVLRDFKQSAAVLDPKARLYEAGVALVDFAAAEPALAAALASGRLLGVADTAAEPRRRLLAHGRDITTLLVRDVQQVAHPASSQADAGSLLLTFWLGLLTAVSRTDSLAISRPRALELLDCQLQILATREEHGRSDAGAGK